MSHRAGSKTHWLYSIYSIVVLSLGLAPTAAQAVPSFARQTGMACAACHTTFPELTPFGRDFKINAYVLNAPPMQTIEDKSVPKAVRLALDEIPPLSFMLQISETKLNKELPDSDPSLAGAFAQNDTVAFPQQLSIFYAGRITPKMGAFVQLTYDGVEDTISIDNTDGRFADTATLGGHSFTYGLTLNNNPTVQDPWNSLPAFGYPFASSSVAPSPVMTMLGGTALAQEVGGLGAYSAYRMPSGLVYGEITAYRTAHPGTTNHGPLGPLDSTVESGNAQGTAPYYRLAYEARWGANSLEIGGLSFWSDTSQQGQPFNTPANRISDRALDLQYQFIKPDNELSFYLLRIWEKQNWGAASGASNPEDKLRSLKLTGSYQYKRTYGAILQHFRTNGDSDPGLYPSGPDLLAASDPGFVANGSANGSPDNKGWIGELFWAPWENTRFSLQYTWYNKYNGGSSDYDGLGRNAKDNNTLYLLAWLMY